MRRGRRLFTAMLLGAVGASGQTPIAEMKVTGASSLPAEAIVAATGLRLGQPVIARDLDAGMSRLFETGLLQSVQYRFDPGPSGLTVTWIVAEETPTLPVELDITGVDEQELWTELSRTHPLVRKTIPENENATAYYLRAIESALAALGKPQPITGKVEGDLATGDLALVFRAAQAPKIAGVRFEGNRTLETKVLEAAISVVASDQDYSERQFRKMLDLNVRPLYEEHGYLTVRFPELAISGGIVAVRVDEGPQWHLGKVEFTGADIPAVRMLEAAGFLEDELANWKRITASIEAAERILKSMGYLRVRSRPARHFRDGSQVVDLKIEVERGPQFVFGELRLTGLSEVMRQRALSFWKLKPGQPMNEPYVTEFLRTVGDSGIPFRSVNLDVEPRPGTTTVDVEIDFK